MNDNEKDLLKPAINGTTSVLEAAKANAPNVKRIVVTSSFASIIDPTKGTWPEHTYSEADWNPFTYEQAAGTKDTVVGYVASKRLAELSAWDFVKEQKPQFTISTICPPMVYGPVAHYVPSLDKLNTSVADIYRLFNGSTKEVPVTTFPLFVDVRNVGQAHLRAFEVPEAANQRFLIESGNFFYSQVCEILLSEFPQLKGKVPVPSGSNPPVFKATNEKATSILGISFYPLKETIVDLAKSVFALEEKLKA